MSNEKLQTLAANLSSMKEKMEEAKRAAEETMKKEIDPLFGALFEAVPALKSVTWTQYTPYFADGEECIFHANDPEFSNDDNSEFESYRSDGDLKKGVWSYSYGVSRAKELSAAEKESIAVFLKAFYSVEDVLKDMLGDHVLVRYTPEGKFETREYEHD